MASSTLPLNRSLPSIKSSNALRAPLWMAHKSSSAQPIWQSGAASLGVPRTERDDEPMLFARRPAELERDGAGRLAQEARLLGVDPKHARSDEPSLECRVVSREVRSAPHRR